MIYYTILYYTVLYCTVLYYTILYYTILYYTISITYVSIAQMYRHFMVFPLLILLWIPWHRPCDHQALGKAPSSVGLGISTSSPNCAKRLASSAPSRGDARGAWPKDAQKTVRCELLHEYVYIYIYIYVVYMWISCRNIQKISIVSWKIKAVKQGLT